MCNQNLDNNSQSNKKKNMIGCLCIIISLTIRLSTVYQTHCIGGHHIRYVYYTGMVSVCQLTPCDLTLLLPCRMESAGQHYAPEEEVCQ